VTNVASVTGGGELNATNNGAKRSHDDHSTCRPDHRQKPREQFSPGRQRRHILNQRPQYRARADRWGVTVVDTLPAGLTPTVANSASLTDGWSPLAAGVTATRNDVLAVGAAYPALTLTVRVADDAPSQVANTATVSGGGEVNLANNSATDTTAITPRADLTIRKTHSGDFTQGDLRTFTRLLSATSVAA